MMKKIIFFLSLALSIAVLQSCEKDPKPEDGLAPQLPPAESFIKPFTGRKSVDTPGVSSDDLEFRGPTYRNSFHAASNVFVWNTVLAVNMAIPVASFLEAFNHNPTYEGNGIFVWSYDVQVAGQTYIASLSGQFVNNNEDVEWIMTVSQVGGFSDFVYYSGIVATDGSEATWTLNHKPLSPEPYIGVDYQKNLATQDISIRYTNVIPNNPDNGDYIEYRTDAAGDFNRAYDVNRGADDFLEILWNVPSNEGRVRHERRFGDTDWHCWDTQLMDTDC